MVGPRTLQFFCLMLSALCTFGVAELDRLLVEAPRTAWHVTQARQLAAQVDSLVLASPRQATGSDPLAWAITVLNAGPVGKTIQLGKKIREPGGAAASEKWSWKEDRFVYEKLLRPTEGLALEVEIHAAYRGMLGMPSRWAADLAAILVTIGFFAIFYPAFGRRWGALRTESSLNSSSSNSSRPTVSKAA